MLRLAEAGVRCTAHDLWTSPRERPELQPRWRRTVLVSSQNALHAWTERDSSPSRERKRRKLRSRRPRCPSTAGSIHVGARRGLGEIAPSCGSTRMPTVEDALPGPERAKVEVYDTLHASRRMDGPWDGILFFSPSGVRSYHASNAQLPRLLHWGDHRSGGAVVWPSRRAGLQIHCWRLCANH